VDDKNRTSRNKYKILHDEEFIKWRLFRTKESEEQWNNFSAENPSLQRSIEEAITQFNSLRINRRVLSEDEKQEMYTSILRKIQKIRKRKIRKIITSSAAILLLFIASALYVWNNKNSGEFNLGDNETIIGQTLPDEEIQLISGKNIIPINQEAHIGLTQDSKALITDSTDNKREITLASQEINQLIVPFGKRTDITLSDGTHIWLNSGTQLDFPTVFTGKTREIYVYGEIFIDVAHNSKIPFIVRSKEIEIEVYGTSFNVSAYNDDNKKTVVLIDGKITIKTEGNDKIDLFPNEKIDIEEHKLLKEKVDVSEYISWTKGVLEFEQTPMSEILKKIGRYYNVRFDGSPDIALNEKSCSGKLFLSNNLDSVLTSVSVLSSTIYKRENNKIHIIKK